MCDSSGPVEEESEEIPVGQALRLHAFLHALAMADDDDDDD